MTKLTGGKNALYGAGWWQSEKMFAGRTGFSPTIFETGFDIASLIRTFALPNTELKHNALIYSCSWQTISRPSNASAATKPSAC